jgi:hypothetical protein
MKVSMAEVCDLSGHKQSRSDVGNGGLKKLHEPHGILKKVKK